MIEPHSWRVLFVTGIPGAGKSTLAGILARELERTLITTHELVERVDPGCLERGEMANPAAMRRAFVLTMDEHEADPLVVDGWPRSLDQAQLLPEDSAVFLLTCRPDIAIERQLRRGREHDTPEIVEKRTHEQAALLELNRAQGWAFQLAGFERGINTTYKSPTEVAAGVLAYLRGRVRQAFDHPRENQL